MQADLGHDHQLSLQHARAHRVVMNALQQKEALDFSTAFSNADLLKLSLDELKDRMVSPDALSLRNIPLQRLASRYTLSGLADFGFTYKHMLATGLRSRDLSSMTYPLLQQLGVRANDLLDVRPRPSHIAAMQLSPIELRDLGCGNLTWLKTVGYRSQTMREHKNLSLRDWAVVTGGDPPASTWRALGFVSFDACCDHGWNPDELYELAFAHATPALTATPPAPPAATVARASSPLPRSRSRLPRLTFPGIA